MLAARRWIRAVPCHDPCALSKPIRAVPPCGPSSFCCSAAQKSNQKVRSLTLPDSMQVPLVLAAKTGLRGRVRVPGDKSISHRALMFGALAIGETIVEGLLEGEDVIATANAMRAMGATIEVDEHRTWRVHGVGVGSLLQPDAALDMGNSGTSTRLLAGLVATHPISATFVGDASLSRRPMQRVIAPLTRMGARFCGNGDRLPLRVDGVTPASAIEYRLPVASAQVKSAVLLAGLNTPGVTRVIEPFPTRDHSERMLKAFGAELTVEDLPGGVRSITIAGEADLHPLHIRVPGDISSAAFSIVAALVVPGSDIVIENVGLNPTRTGLLDALAQLGADIEIVDRTDVGDEPVGTLRVRHGGLRGAEIDPVLAPRMIDEYPALMVAAAFADGRTTMRGLGELRVKESDRLAVMAAGLSSCGVVVEELADGIIVTGSGGKPIAGGATVASHLDHRIAMSFAVLGLHARLAVTVDDARPIATSFPDFVPLMMRLGAMRIQ